MRQILIIGFLILTNFTFSQTQSERSLLKAKDAFNSKDYSTALSLYNRIIKADKGNSEALFWRGRTKVELKDFEGAKKDFTSVLKILPNHSGALVNRGNLFSLLKDYQNSLIDFNKAEEINSADVAVFLNRGKTYFRMKKYYLAIADYTKAIALNPDDKYAYHKRSECYNYAGMIDLAEKDLEKILEIDSTDIEAKTNLAFCYITTKRYQDANVLYEQLYISEANNPYVLSNFGYVKHILGKPEDGLKLINKSLAIMPDNAYAYKYLAEIYLKQNHVEKACEAIEAGLKLGFTNSYGPELEDLKKANCSH